MALHDVNFLISKLFLLRVLKLSACYLLQVAFGQSIALVGSQEGLGAWDPKGAVGLEWHEGNEWVAEAELPVG